jgi:hypothetical protein
MLVSERFYSRVTLDSSRYQEQQKARKEDGKRKKRHSTFKD